MRFARVNGVTIHFGDTGERGLPVLVFANSLGTDFRIWDGVVEALAGRFRMIRYDKRGHGLSEATPAPYRMEDHAGDLIALLAHLGIERTHVCGLSVGGMIAQAVAAARPALVERLVLIGTAARIGDTAGWNQRIAAVEADGIAALADGVMEKWFTGDFRTAGNPVFAGMKAMLTRSPVEGYVGTCAALRDADLTASTAALDLPVLALAGAEDGSTPPSLVQAMARSISGASFEAIPGAGHIPCVEQPEATARLIDDFLSQPGGA